MIDTLVLSLPISDSYLIPDRISNLTLHHKTTSTTGYHSGHLKNIKIRVTQNTLFLSGSLPKYLYNENLTHLTHSTFENAVIQISEDLGVNLMDSKLSRIDFGVNLHLQNDSSFYINSIQSLPKFKKMTYDMESITFIKKGLVSFLIYDKIREMKENKKKSLIKEIKGNIIRIELQLKGKLENKLGFQPSLSNLMKKENYNHLGEVLFEYYDLVEKKSDPIISPEIISNTKELEHLIFRLGIDSLGGSSAFLNYISPAKTSGEMSRKVFKRFKDLAEYKSESMVKSDAVKEMDDEFLRAVTSLMV